MRKGKIIGLSAVAAMFLFAGCSGTVETGPVPTITPRATVTPAPTPTPVVIEEDKTEVVEESVYDTKRFKEYYEKENELPQLKVAYKELFTVGIDLLQIDVTDSKRQAIVKNQFNIVGCKEDLSPNVIMDYDATVASGDLTRIALDFSGADVILKFAQDNNLPVRGPRLITNETPAWAFTKGFSESQVTTVTDANGKETTSIDYASSEVMLLRMENYIKDVITYCNTNYPGVVISWDVLDDVINSNENNKLGYRTSSGWYQAIGEEYMGKACEFARKYATADQKLIYTQESLDDPGMQKAALALINTLKADKLIDGIGIQGHYSPNGSNVFAMEEMFKALADTGLELHITEFYVSSIDTAVDDASKTKEELLARCAKRYKNLMTLICNMETKKSYDIVSFTFEGLTDETSSLNQPKDYVDIITGEKMHGVQTISYPYLFDEELNVKDNFFAAMCDATIKGY